jgi:uncharacterized membrane protein
MMNPGTDRIQSGGLLRSIGRYLLAGILLFAGIAHLTFARTEFSSQGPDWVPMSKDLVVVLSGFVELALGLGLLALPGRRREMGWIIALFFVLIFPGNIAQFVEHRDAFGLDTDLKRGIRLIFQPLLIALALWSTGALKRTV